MPGAVTLSLTMVAALSTADSAADCLREAERQFRQGAQEQQSDKARQHFAAAARGYARLHAEGAHNAALYTNWGNAELLVGDVPRAILAYRRGLRLEPGDVRLRENLSDARARVDYPPGLARPDLESWLRPGRGVLFAGTALFYSLACLVLCRWFLVRRRGLLGWVALALVFAGICGYLWHVKERQAQLAAEEPLVVVTQETGFFRGNGVLYPTHAEVPTLYAGIEGRLLQRRGDWFRIELPGGATGWVPREAVIVDE